MVFEWDRDNFTPLFHFKYDKGNHRQVKSPRWRVEKERKFGIRSNADLEFEMVQINYDRMIGFLDHTVTPETILLSLKGQAIFIVTVRTVTLKLYGV